MTSGSLARLARAAALAAAALGATAAQAAVPSFSQLVVFGDSISDTGNVALAYEFIAGIPGASNGIPQTITNTHIPDFPYPTNGTYYPATLTNGPVWATRFAARMGLAAGPSLMPGGTNFAFGGARVELTTDVPSLKDQLNLFLGATGGLAPAGALYVVGEVGNNARDTLEAIAGGANPATQIPTDAQAYASGIGDIVDTLQGSGAQNILVLNNANLGLAPFVLETDKVSPGAAALAGGVAVAYNAALGARLATEPGVQVFDTFSFLTGLVANPAAYGFTNTTDACGAAPAGTACREYVFWDGIHPTRAGHRQLANAIYAQVVPEPETWALMVFGLGAVGWVARRRRLASR